MENAILSDNVREYLVDYSLNHRIVLQPGIQHQPISIAIQGIPDPNDLFFDLYLNTTIFDIIYGFFIFKIA